MDSGRRVWSRNQGRGAKSHLHILRDPSSKHCTFRQIANRLPGTGAGGGESGRGECF